MPPSTLACSFPQSTGPKDPGGKGEDGCSLQKDCKHTSVNEYRGNTGEVHSVKQGVSV